MYEYHLGLYDYQKVILLNIDILNTNCDYNKYVFRWRNKFKIIGLSQGTKPYPIQTTCSKFDILPVFTLNSNFSTKATDSTCTIEESTKIEATAIEKLVKNGQYCYSSQILTAAVGGVETTAIADIRYKYILDACVAALLAAS